MQNSTAAVTAYPAVPGLAQSDVYQITVNNTPIWTEKTRTNYDLEQLPDWFRGSAYTNQQQEVHIANFSGEGRLHVTIESIHPVVQAEVRPASRGIQPVVHGNSVEFDATGPDNFYITIDNLPPLLFFANPAEENLPSPETTGVHVFGPGVHRPGLIEMHDGETLCLAPGAVVYGWIRATNAHHIVVRGHGILDGSFENRLVHIWNSSDITFEGVTLRNGKGWTNTLENCEDVTYRDVKVVSFGPSGDGIDPLNSRRVNIERCIFRCTDDCIAIKAPDPKPISEHIRITGCTMIGFAYADGVTIGFETNNPSISDVVVSDCDILQSRGGSRVDGHAAFSVICDGPARISNIRYENIRVEPDVLKLFELHVTDGTDYGDDPPGHIADVHLKNISWASARPIILHGFDANHRVSGVTFEGCTIEGEPVTTARPDIFQVNDYVDDVKFIASEKRDPSS